MSEDYYLVSINEKNQVRFKEYLPDNAETELTKKDRLVGIRTKTFERGAFIVRRKAEEMIIRSFNMDPSVEDPDAYSMVFTMLGDLAACKGFKQLLFSYTDSDPRINKDVLHSAGFTEFKKSAQVYKINAKLLGSLLCESPDALNMRLECVELLDAERTYSLDKAPEKFRSLFEGLDAVGRLSYLSVNDKKELQAYVAISRLPDGTCYLADYKCTSEEGVKDLSGLLYMSLGSVLMEIEPDGEFYIVALSKRLSDLYTSFFLPIRKEVIRQNIILAKKML